MFFRAHADERNDESMQVEETSLARRLKNLPREQPIESRKLLIAEVEACAVRLMVEGYLERRAIGQWATSLPIGVRTKVRRLTDRRFISAAPYGWCRLHEANLAC